MDCGHWAPIALTVTPAASRPARIFAARSSEPGVSPCTQIVSASSGTTEPSIATTVRSFTMRTARATTGAGIVDDRAGLAARGERAVGLVGAIGEHFGGDAQAGGAAGVQDLRAGQTEQNQRLVEGGHRARDRGGELRVADRHVEQRAVRLDVLDLHAFGGGDAGDRGDLIEHEVLGFLRRDVQLAAAEADEIGKPRMRADRDAVRLREPNRRAQHRRIAGVKSGGDVGRRDRRISPASWPMV